MALQNSGQISLNDIHVEVGGNSGTQVSFNDADVRDLISASSESEIEMADFYGASSQIIMSSAGAINGYEQQKEIVISDFISSGQTIYIPTGFFVWSDNTSVPALKVDIPCTIINQGYILGKGGVGGSPGNSGSNGGIAIQIQASNVNINNQNTGYIYGGGGGGGGGNSGHSGSGGGGGGAGGGNGGAGWFETNQISGGVIGATGSSSTRGNGGNGGQGGGSGAGSFNSSNSSNDGGAGGGGGRVIAPTSNAAGGVGGTSNWWHSNGGYGAASGNGGNAFNPNSYQPSFISSAGGGGGYASNGGQGGGSNGGGVGADAINSGGNAYSLTNFGTILGSV